MSAERDRVLRDLLEARLEATDGAWGIVVDVTDGCWQGCLTCPATRPGDVMDLAGVEVLGEVMMPHGEYLALGCLAEPLLHPEIRAVVQVLHRAKERSDADTFICLLTAATTAGQGDRILDLADAGLDVFLASVDSTSSKTYAKIRGGADWDDTRARLLNALPILKARGVRCGAQVMLLRSTVSGAAETAGGLVELGFESVNFTQPTQVPARAAGEVLRTGEPGFKELVNLADTLAEDPRMDGVFWTLPRNAPEVSGGLHALFGDGATLDEDRLEAPKICVAPWHNLRVDAGGRVFPCNFMDAPEDALGVLGEADFQGIVAGPRAVAIRRALLDGRAGSSACERCAFGPGVST